MKSIEIKDDSLSNEYVVTEKQVMLYEDFVKALVKDGQAIIDTLTPERMNLVHMSIGVSGEAGELLDAIKKYVVYNKALDKTNVIEELGDIEFYMQEIRRVIGVTRQEVVQPNVEKLNKRYSTLYYSDSQANARADKQ